MSIILLSTLMLEQGTAAADLECFFQSLRWVLAPSFEFYAACMDAIGGPLPF